MFRREVWARDRNMEIIWTLYTIMVEGMRNHYRGLSRKLFHWPHLQKIFFKYKVDISWTEEPTALENITCHHQMSFSVMKSGLQSVTLGLNPRPQLPQHVDGECGNVRVFSYDI